jgi:uncharacterized protein (TIGR03437 family)
VSLSISQGPTTVDVLPAFVSPGQINAILPSNAPLGWVTLRVSYNGAVSNPARLFVVENSVGLFAVNSGGFGPGIVQNFVSQAEQPVNSLARTARPGQVVTLWGTGLGAAPFADNVAPQAVSLDVQVEVLIGGKRGRVLYSGRTPCCAAIDQFVFEVPADAPAGCYVPVAVRTRGASASTAVVSNTVTMAIEGAGGECRDAQNPLTEQFRRGGKVALAHLVREQMHVDVRTAAPFDVTHDALLAAFRTEAGSEFYFNTVTALPPAGTCTVYGGAAASVFEAGSPFAPRGTAIDVGSPVTVTAGPRSVAAATGPGFEGSFLTVLGRRGLVEGMSPPILDGGPFSIAVPGGGLLGAFTAVLENVNPVNWTNREETAEIRRGADLTVRWTGDPGAGRGVMVLGLSEQTSTNAVSGFACLAPAGAASFTVPAYVIQALPASDAAEPYASARISVGNVPLSAGPAVVGGDFGYVGMSSWVSRVAVVE